MDEDLLTRARLMDSIFLRQVWSGNPALLERLERDKSESGRERLHYFRINAGPWSRLDKNEPFIEGVPPEKPPQGSFYPDDMTKDEFNAWVRGLTEEERERATGFFSVIRRGPNGKLKAVPYSQEYRELLAPAANLLREAAALTDKQRASLRQRRHASLTSKNG